MVSKETRSLLVNDIVDAILRESLQSPEPRENLSTTNKLVRSAESFRRWSSSNIDTDVDMNMNMDMDTSVDSVPRFQKHRCSSVSMDSDAAVCTFRSYTNVANASNSIVSKSRSIKIGNSRTNNDLPTSSSSTESYEVTKGNVTAPNTRPSLPRWKKERILPLPSLEVGSIAPDFELEDAMGFKHRLSNYRGRKVLLSFLCHNKIDRIRKQYAMLLEAGVLVICIAANTTKNVARYASKSLVGGSLIVLNDKKGAIYNTYKIKDSSKSTQSKLRSIKDTLVNGMRLFPEAFFINEDGTIDDRYRSELPMKTALPIEKIEAFLPNGMCQCNKKDCLLIRCRNNWKSQAKRETAIIRNPKQNIRRTIAQLTMALSSRQMLCS